MTYSENIYSTERSAFCQIITHHVICHPQLMIQDLYKLIYQGALGSEHAVLNPSQARVWLEQEIKLLSHGIDEPAIDPISADEKIVRVNLSPYLAGGGNMDILLAGFIRTAKEYKGTEAKLKRHWQYTEEMSDEGTLGFEISEMKNFFAEMEKKGFPAIHHSKAYKDAYQPAYRVALQEYLTN